MPKQLKARRVTTADVLAKAPTNIPVPLREIDSAENITLGFRAEFFSCGETGRISSGAGLGSVWISLDWKGRSACVSSVDLLAAWVETFDPEDAKRIREAGAKATGVTVTTHTDEEIDDEP